jgi:hypothetical protein
LPTASISSINNTAEFLPESRASSLAFANAFLTFDAPSPTNLLGNELALTLMNGTSQEPAIALAK